MPEIIPVKNGSVTEAEAQRAVEILRSGGQILLPTDSGYMRAVNLFHAEALSHLMASCEEGAVPIALPARVEHIEALAADISADARIVIRRLMPGSLAIALTASPLMPTAALLPGKRVALCAPAIPVVAQVAERLGAPLLGVYGGRNASDTDMLLDAGELPPAQPTVLDVTRRPARILQAGAPERAILERIVLLEE